VKDLEGIALEGRDSRRDVLKKMAYVAPIVLSIAASPAFARSGSGTPSSSGNRYDPEPTRGRRPE
jgi:hypothetical protein